MKRRLEDVLAASRRRGPAHTAVEGPGGAVLSYRELARRAEVFCNLLKQNGVQAGDRVGIYAHKSVDVVAAIFGILQAGAAYVPVDPDSPPQRNAFIFSDCRVKAVCVAHNLLETLRNAFPAKVLGEQQALEAKFELCCQFFNFPGEAEDRSFLPAAENTRGDDDHLAYILYTSGSTGKPKGVMISHHNALSFVDWCSDIFSPLPADRFSSHAPFHFDLSILDLYVSIKHGATLVLIDETTAKQPEALAAFIAEHRISVWYSAPSILSLMAQFGNMIAYDYSALRLVLFAGEVFPVKYLRMLKQIWAGPRYFNLYGPTETNVCTFYEIPAEIPDMRSEPYPIGKTCAHLQTLVLGDDGVPAAPGAEGELLVSGAAVMAGYWHLPERTATAFYTDAVGIAWYKTGDLVRVDASGDFIFLGRRDRMVKRRGYRIELGEIEAALYRHPAVVEAAVAAEKEEDGVSIRAFLHLSQGEKLSLIKLKQFCAAHLPLYMIPDKFSYLETLPKTSTGKVDYQKLLMQEI